MFRSENGAGAELVRGVKKLLWAREDVPPALSIPDRLYYVTGPGDLFEEAINRLQQVDKLGVSLEGEVVGRHGTPSLLLLSTDIGSYWNTQYRISSKTVMRRDVTFN